MFLMGLIEPGSQRRCWITPGGAIDPGEDPFSALRRETMEELGLHLSESDIGAAIWRRRATFSWDGEETDQEETYFLIETSRFEPVRCFDGDAETTLLLRRTEVVDDGGSPRDGRASRAGTTAGVARPATVGRSSPYADRHHEGRVSTALKRHASKTGATRRGRRRREGCAEPSRVAVAVPARYQSQPVLSSTPRANPGTGRPSYAARISPARAGQCRVHLVQPVRTRLI